MPDEIECGVVVIGRNEGPRLGRCLASLGPASALLYVDSGSVDGSVAVARAMGARTLELDGARAFSASRARNEGFASMLESHPRLTSVQFVDGDCELEPSWLSRAAAVLRSDPATAIVCGRVRERDRARSVYNLLCDMEFNRPAGEVAACGGIFLARVEALREVGGFDTGVVAGEEPELCLRLRRRGYKVIRLGEGMCLHDSGMTRFSQWWKRSVRSGYAYALGAAMHGSGPERHCVRECGSILAWTLLPPVLAAGLSWVTHGLSAMVLLAYPLQGVRIALRRRVPGETMRERLLFGAFCMIAKFAQLRGMMRYLAERRRPTIIEYK